MAGRASKRGLAGPFQLDVICFRNFQQMLAGFGFDRMKSTITPFECERDEVVRGEGVAQGEVGQAGEAEGSLKHVILQCKLNAEMGQGLIIRWEGWRIGSYWLIFELCIIFEVMKNKLRRLSRSSDKDQTAPLTSKPKSKKSELSLLHDSCHHSFGAPSPRPANAVEKYKTYIQFIATNKLTTNHTEQRPSLPKKMNAPRKNSPVPYLKTRRSNTSRHQTPSPSHFSPTQKHFFPKEREANKDKGVGFLVHGKNVMDAKKSIEVRERSASGRNGENSKKGAKSRDKLKTKKSTQKVSSKSNVGKDLNREEEKLCEKLFKGIQFYRDLGRGAHALVKSAVDWNHKRKIAVKVYEKSELSEQELTSIEREIQILNGLTHPNIITLYEIIETFKTINLVMEYGGGNSLEQYIKSKPEGFLQESQAKLIFRQILEAVDFLHAKMVTHRDIKTENILLNKHLHIKIIDFGFSLLCLPTPNYTINSYCGTPTYMAPEVVSKTLHHPQLSDRWSLGVLLFNMLNGHCPFRATSQKELFSKIVRGEYEYIAPVSPAGKDLIGKFLQKSPTSRLSPGEALSHPWLAGQS